LNNQKIGPYKRLSSTQKYKNPWITVREDKIIHPNGDPGIYGVVESSDSVFVFLFNNNDKFPIIKQFRYPTQTWSWELPAGSIEEGDTAKQASTKELQEEVGIIVSEGDWKNHGKLQTSNGITSSYFYIFSARREIGDIELEPEDDQEGITEIKWVSFEEVFEMIRTGGFDDSACLAAVQKVYLDLTRG
jgi:8-oxo-dGTP pyrophosphatase MutT (NUDIX family)